MKRIKVEILVLVEDADTDELITDQSFRTAQTIRLHDALDQHLKGTITEVMLNVHGAALNELDRRIPVTYEEGWL